MIGSYECENEGVNEMNIRILSRRHEYERENIIRMTKAGTRKVHIKASNQQLGNEQSCECF